MKCCPARALPTINAPTAKEWPARAMIPIRGCTAISWLPIRHLPIRKGRQLGTVHVLKDITDRKRAEEKYRTLISNVQEGVFISTPQGRFLDFNDALMRMLGYDTRDALLRTEIASIYVTPSDRERLKKLLNEHGSVADFEFEVRRKDGEVRNVMESSIAVRDSAGNVTAFQGFLLDITDRIRAEQEIRRRNRELLVLNSIAQTLIESMDLSDSLHRILRQMSELFSLDASSLYLFDENALTLRRIAVVGYRSEFARHFPVVSVQPELLPHIKSVHATFLSAQGLAASPGLPRNPAKGRTGRLVCRDLVVQGSCARRAGRGHSIAP